MFWFRSLIGSKMMPTRPSYTPDQQLQDCLDSYVAYSARADQRLLNCHIINYHSSPKKRKLNEGDFEEGSSHSNSVAPKHICYLKVCWCGRKGRKKRRGLGGVAALPPSIDVSTSSNVAAPLARERCEIKEHSPVKLEETNEDVTMTDSSPGAQFPQLLDEYCKSELSSIPSDSTTTNSRDADQQLYPNEFNKIERVSTPLDSAKVHITPWSNLPEDSETQEDDRRGKNTSLPKKETSLVESINLFHSGITEIEKDMIRSIANRGFEPGIPISWEPDFPSFPKDMFVGEDKEPSILALSGNELKGIRSLQDLLSLTDRVKSLTDRKREASVVIEKKLKSYISWAISDANLNKINNSYPVHDIFVVKKNQTVEDTLKALKTRLESLARRHHRQHPTRLRKSALLKNEKVKGENGKCPELPMLFGLLIHGSTVHVTIFDTSRASDAIGSEDTSYFRVLTSFDLSDGDHDWKTLALALVVMRIRKTLLGLAESC